MTRQSSLMGMRRMTRKRKRRRRERRSKRPNLPAALGMAFAVAGGTKAMMRVKHPLQLAT